MLDIASGVATAVSVFLFLGCLVDDLLVRPNLLVEFFIRSELGVVHALLLFSLDLLVQLIFFFAVHVILRAALDRETDLLERDHFLRPFLPSWLDFLVLCAARVLLLDQLA